MRKELANCFGTIAITMLLAGSALAAAPARPADPVAAHALVREVPFNKVHIEDAFWAPRIEMIQKVTIPEVLAIAEEQGKIDNVRIIAGRKKDGRIRTYNSPDSDVWKIMEGASYTLAWRRDAKLEKQIDDLIELYAAAQAADGYINTMFMLPPEHPQAPPAGRAVDRYGYTPEQKFKGPLTDRPKGTALPADWPRGMGQLYSSGHLFEAATAHYRATGKRNFLDIAIKMADCIYRALPPGKPFQMADHPQLGIGLVKLYEVTGDRKYLELADHIVHHGQHGRPNDVNRESWKPIEQQRKAWGHAVRTGYLYSEATDLSRYLGQPETREAVDSLWHSIVDRRIYIHGGIGGPADWEQMADDYVLHNWECYCECCANIAHGQWNHRLNLLYGDAKYTDLVEIESYNGALSGISLDGKKFSYRNMLAIGKEGREDQFSGVRTRYLFCCPAKLPGFVAGISRWVYAQDDRGIYVNQYVGGTAEVDLPGGGVTVRQETGYPWKGSVKLSVKPTQPHEFDVCLRIPGWASGPGPMPSDLYRFTSTNIVGGDWNVCVNGKPWKDRTLDKGYLRIHRVWQSGDNVELELGMPVRKVAAHEKVTQNRGRVALMRGPVVYCLEGVDNKFDLFDAALPEHARLVAEHRDDLLGGVTVLRGQLLADGKREAAFMAVPYYTWQNRGIAEMNVWIQLAPNPQEPAKE